MYSLYDNETLSGSLRGYWGEPSSSVDWCEENYVWSHYIAEWWNTWSNVPPLVLALGAMIAASTSAKDKQQPSLIKWAYSVPVIVFAGSFVFHATLTYFGQLLDELPMIYGSIYFHYLHCRNWKHAKEICFTTAVAITVVMIVFRDSPLPLQLSYGALVSVLELPSRGRTVLQACL